MWTCPECNQEFLNRNSTHSCNDRTIEDFLEGKTDYSIELFHFFINEYQKIGPFRLHPAKSRIAFAAKIRFGYIHRIGKNFIDVVLTFPKPHTDNYCFFRIGEVPGGKYYQHYLRIEHTDDINQEVRNFMKMAFEIGNKTR